MDNLDTVADKNYLEAYALAAEFMDIFTKLPEYGNLTTAERSKVERMDEILSNMTDYQKSFLTDDDIEQAEKYIARMKDLVKIEGGDGES